MDSDEEESDEETKGPQCPVSVYLAEGRLQFGKGNYVKALECYDTVLEREPENKRCLVARSKCHFKLNNYRAALQDAEDAIKLDRKSVHAVFQKAEIEYMMGNFEGALVTFQRGFMRRPDYADFRFGVQKCQQAILNSIGSSAGITLTEKDVIANEQRKKKEALPPKVPQRKIDFNARTLLKEIAADKEYLEDLLEDPRIKEYVEPESRMVVGHVRNELKYIQGCQDFWQQQKPLYSRKKVRCELRRPLIHRSATRIVTVVDEGIPLPAKIPRLVENVQRLLKQKKYDKCVELGREVLSLVKPVSRNILYNKPQLQVTCLETMAEAYQALNNETASKECHDKTFSIAVKFDLKDAQSRTLQSIARDYIQQSDYDRACAMFSKKLALCGNDAERAYVYHEMGRCQLSLRNLELSKEYATKSLQYATRANSLPWRMNANALLAELAVAAEDWTTALAYFESAIADAEEKGDIEVKTTLEHAVEKIKANTQQPITDESFEGQTSEDQTSEDQTSEVPISSDKIPVDSE